MQFFMLIYLLNLHISVLFCLNLSLINSCCNTAIENHQILHESGHLFLPVNTVIKDEVILFCNVVFYTPLNRIGSTTS